MFIHEKARETPVVHECDVCVVGGSCTGVFAAVRAARLGASVALVENNGFFGGVATAGLVNYWHSVYDTMGDQVIIGGLTVEVIERLAKTVSLIALSSYIGIRETRHANCLRRLTEREVLDGVRFPDAIANGSYRVDVHHSEKAGLTF